MILGVLRTVADSWRVPFTAERARTLVGGAAADEEAVAGLVERPYDETRPITKDRTRLTSCIEPAGWGSAPWRKYLTEQPWQSNELMAVGWGDTSASIPWVM